MRRVECWGHVLIYKTWLMPDEPVVDLVGILILMLAVWALAPVLTP